MATRRRPRSVAQIEHDAKAVDLRRQNKSYRQIAADMGLSVSNAYKAVQRGLADTIQEASDEVRQMAADRYDEMARVAWQVIHTPHYAVSSSGKVPLHPDTDEPLMDDGPKLAALGHLRQIEERRARLLGLDAPVKLQSEVTHVDSYSAEIARLMADMAARGTGPAAGHPEVLPVAEPGA